MTKTTREGKKVRVRGPRLASPPSIRLREEQSDSVSSTCSQEPMKGYTSVDPTERPNSEFVVPSQQPTLILVVFAIAPEDPGRNFPNFRPAPPWKSKLLAQNLPVHHLMNGYCIFAQYCYYEYTCLHSSTCVAPARDSPLFSNEPIFPQTFGEDFAPPPSRASILRRWMLHHLLLRREHQSFEDGCCTTYCCEPAGEATRKRLFRIDRDRVYSRGGAA